MEPSADASTPVRLIATRQFTIRAVCPAEEEDDPDAVTSKPSHGRSLRSTGALLPAAAAAAPTARRSRRRGFPQPDLEMPGPLHREASAVSDDLGATQGAPVPPGTSGVLVDPQQKQEAKDASLEVPQQAKRGGKAKKQATHAVPEQRMGVVDGEAAAPISALKGGRSRRHTLSAGPPPAAAADEGPHPEQQQAVSGNTQQRGQVTKRRGRGRPAANDTAAEEVEQQADDELAADEKSSQKSSRSSGCSAAGPVAVDMNSNKQGGEAAPLAPTKACSKETEAAASLEAEQPAKAGRGRKRGAPEADNQAEAAADAGGVATRRSSRRKTGSMAIIGR